MSIFKIFKSEPFSHSQFELFKRSGNKWCGKINQGNLPDTHLLLSGDRTHPDEEAIRLAVELQDRFDDLIPIIAVALLEHYLPYRRAVEAGVFDNAPKPFPMIDSADQVWPYVCLEQVIIEPQRDVMTVEFDYSISWDEEHTVGARFCDWQFEELCGSV